MDNSHSKSRILKSNVDKSSLLLLLLSSNFTSGVCQLDADLLGAFNNISSFLKSLKIYSGTNVMSNFGTEGSVVHQKDIKVFRIVNNKFLQSIGEEKFGGIVRSITDFRHFLVASKATTHSVINTWK
jgi:hypothetical protein